MKRIIFLVICIAASLLSCDDTDTVFLEKEKLFTLSYGKMDDQLDMTAGKSLTPAIPALNRMVKGIFYIMNGNLDKIMKFSSYGDLLSVLGKRETDTGAALVEEEVGENERVNRKAVYFPFNNIEEFTVDDRQYIYVSDLLPQERHELDKESGDMLSNIIYRFDNNCNLIDSIGQDGAGGIPFPYIKNISVRDNHDFTVVTSAAKGEVVYWFSENGDLLYRIEIGIDNIPYPPGEKILEASVSTVKPATGENLLFMKTDYYEKTVNPATGAETDIDFYKSFINILDIETGKFTGMIDIPDVFTVSDIQGNLMEKRLQVLYNFLDVVDDRYLFLAAMVNSDTVQILVLDTEGNVRGQTRINIDFEAYHHVDMDISREGILSAIMAGNSDATVSWWRTDSLIRK